jgi:hypothetical protein
MNHEGLGEFVDLDPEIAWSISMPCSTDPVSCRAVPDPDPDKGPRAGFPGSEETFQLTSYQLSRKLRKIKYIKIIFIIK